MARGRRPAVRWWARNGGGYYVTHQGRQVCLAMGPDDFPEGETYKKAVEKWGQLLRADQGRGTDGLGLESLFNSYKSYLEHLKKTASLSNLTYMAGPFVEKWKSLTVGQLRGFHVREWLMGQTRWNGSSQRLAVKMIASMLNWGVKDGLIASNPLKGRVDLPSDIPRGRESRLDRVLSSLILQAASPAFRPLVQVWRDTGCRPEEAEQVEAWNIEGSAIVYRWNASRGHVHKQAKRGKKVDRIIHFTPELVEMVTPLRRKYQDGPLFRTSSGVGWTKHTRNIEWRRVMASGDVKWYLRDMGIAAKKIVPYSFRHSFISDWIDAGMSVAVVAELCGTSVAMIEKSYGHPDPARMKEFYIEFMKNR